METRLGTQVEQLFQTQQYMPRTATRDIALKLHGLSELLQLTPYNSTGQFQKKLGPISLSEIEPIRIICPISMTCTTSTCKPVHLEQLTRTRDIPIVTLIQGNKILKNVLVMTGVCNTCHTHYELIMKAFWFQLKTKALILLKKDRRFTLILLAISKLELVYGLTGPFPMQC